MAHESNDRGFDPGFDPGALRVLEELRDLRIEMREDRQRADEDRRRSDEDRRRSDERFERTLLENRRETKAYLDGMIREFSEDSARREAATQKVITELRTDMRTVGLAIVRTLNRHTRLLERIDRKLGARDNGRPGPGNGRRG